MGMADTALHLCLYHKDILIAPCSSYTVALNSTLCGKRYISEGCKLNHFEMNTHWTLIFSLSSLAEAMASILERYRFVLMLVENENGLHRILAAITTPHMLAPTPSRCIQCNATLRTRISTRPLSPLQSLKRAENVRVPVCRLSTF